MIDSTGLNKYAAFVLLAFALALASTSVLAANSGRIDSLVGEVIIVSDSGEQRNGDEGGTLQAGDTVRTGADSHVVLKFDDGQVIVLEANTAFSIEDYRFAERRAQTSRIIFALLEGGLRAISGRIAELNRSAFKLKVASFLVGVRGTDFAVVRGRSEELYTRVYAGAIALSDGVETVLFEAGQTAVLRSQWGRLTVLHDARPPAGIFQEIESIPVSQLGAPTIRQAGSQPGRSGRAGRTDPPKHADQKLAQAQDPLEVTITVIPEGVPLPDAVVKQITLPQGAADTEHEAGRNFGQSISNDAANFARDKRSGFVDYEEIVDQAKQIGTDARQRARNMGKGKGPP